MAGVRRELARLYREARAGELDVAAASRLANVLQILGRMIEGSEIEARVEALEREAPAPGAGARRREGRRRVMGEAWMRVAPRGGGPGQERW
ncbi:MAG TPA: hypothetical protein VF606_00215 [Geminicoccaceae bacterium]